MMLSSKLSRIRCQCSRAGQQIRLAHIKSPSDGSLMQIQSRLEKMSEKRPRTSILPSLDSSQLVDERDSLQREMLSYEQADQIATKGGLLLKEKSPFRPLLLRFLELELLRISSQDFSNINRFHSFFSLLMRKLKMNKPALDYLESNLSNDSFVTFNLFYNPKYYVMFMNKEIEMTFKDEDLPNDDKMKRVDSILDVSNAVRQQFKQRGIFHDERFELSFANCANVMNILPREDYLHFFLRLLDLDSRSVSSNGFKKLRYELFTNGDTTERAAYEFEALFTSKDEEDLSLMKSKFIILYSFDMIKNIVVKYIKNDDAERADFYLEYLMAKYALEKEKRKGNCVRLTESLYEVITYHVVKLKNYSSAIELLNSLEMNNIKLTPRMLLILAATFRKKQMYDAVIVVLNKVAKMFDGDTSVGTRRYKSLLATELLITIREQFPGDPKVIVSQFLSIFPGSEVMLNELGIISFLFNGTVNEVPDLEAALPELYKAEISDFFKVHGFPSCQNMTEVYIAILSYISIHNITLPKEYVYEQLFKLFLKYTEKVQKLDAIHHPFCEEKLDEGIVNVFVRRVLLDTKNVQMATQMVMDFLQTCNFKRFDGKAISRILAHSENSTGAEIDTLVTIMEALKVPLGVHPLIAFILKANRHGEIDEARKWYDKLLKLNQPITHFRLIKVIKEHGWQLPENFDESLLDVEYRSALDRGEDPDDTVYIDDPEFVDILSATLDKFDRDIV